MAQTKSLQININSPDDARAVIAHLNKIKAAYDQAECDSVEFYIAAPIRDEIWPILTGAVGWCKSYQRLLPVGEGNVYFPLPHYVMPTIVKTPALPVQPVADPKPETNRRTHGKTQRPVPAMASAT